MFFLLLGTFVFGICVAYFVFFNTAISKVINNKVPETTDTFEKPAMPLETKKITVADIYSLTVPSTFSIVKNEGNGTSSERATLTAPGLELTTFALPGGSNSMFYDENTQPVAFNGVTWKYLPPSEYCDAGNCGQTIPVYTYLYDSYGDFSEDELAAVLVQVQKGDPSDPRIGDILATIQHL